MTAIDITALRQLLTQQGDAVWVSLGSGRALGSAHQSGVICVLMPIGFATSIDKHAWSH